MPLAAPFNGTQLEPLQADDAAQETGADPAAAAAAAEALQLEAAAAIAAQRAGAIPESRALWRAEGTPGTSDDSDIVSAEDSQPDDVDDEADLPSIDSGSGGDAGGDAASPGRDGSGQRSADAAAQDASGQAGSDAAASGSDSEGGYGAGGLSWEAVMAQMLAQQVCVIMFDSTAKFMQFVRVVTTRGVPTAFLQVPLAGASGNRNLSKVLPGLHGTGGSQ